MAEYKYVDGGAGIPGLPHEISDEEADAIGVVELLKAAVDNGSYVLVKESDQESSGQQSAVSDQPSESDVISEDEFEKKTIDELFEPHSEELPSDLPEEKPTKKRKE